MLNENYKVVKPLGQGAFGKVYLVKDSRGREYALKSASIFQPSKYVLNEFNVMKRLSHPRIIKLLDFYPSSNAYNFVLEYAEKGSLRDYIIRSTSANYRLRTDNLMNFFVDIAHGVRYLHENNVIHRDLKPENILIDENWRLKLCDFGVSKVISDNFPQIQTNIGTLLYMSPEVYLHRPYDKSCDIWALGLILYEMAFFKYLFSREDKARIMDYSVSYPCPVVNWNSRGYSDILQELLNCTVQRRPSRRASIEAICSYPLVLPWSVRRYSEEKKYKEEIAAKQLNVLKPANNHRRF